MTSPWNHESDPWLPDGAGAAMHRSDVKKNCSAAYTSDYDPDPEVQAHSYGNWNVAAGFKSRHPGGANFLFGDGSVHFLPEDINMVLYQYLGCRDDGRHIEEIP